MAKQVKSAKGAKVAKFKPTDADKALLKGLTAFAVGVADGIAAERKEADERGQKALNSEAAKVLQSLHATHPTVDREQFGPFLLAALKDAGLTTVQCTRALRSLDLKVRAKGGGRKGRTVAQWGTNVAKEAAEKYGSAPELAVTGLALVRTSCEGDPVAMRERANELREEAAKLEAQAAQLEAQPVEA